MSQVLRFVRVAAISYCLASIAPIILMMVLGGAR